MAAYDSFATGIQAGQALQAGAAAREEKKRKDEARRRMGMYLMGDQPQGPMPQPPMPGQPSVPAGPQMMGAGGAPVMPPGGGQPPMAAPQGAPPGGTAPPPMQMPMPGATPMPQPPPPMPMPQPKPPQPGPEMMGAGGAPQGAPPEQSNPFMDSLHTLQGIAAQIKAANPGITPEQLADATSETLDSMKGVSAETLQWSKALLGADTASNTADSRERIAAGHDTSRESVANIRAQAVRDVSQNTVDWHKYQSDMMYRRAIEAATIAAQSRESVAGTAAGSRENVARIGADSREAVASTNADSRDYGSEVGYEGRVDSAAARTTGVIPGAASGSTKRPFAGRRRTAPGPVDPYAQYSTPGSVAAAFKAGKLSEADARKALATKFGIQ